MGSEEYSITWNDHPGSVLGVFARFFEEEALVDCTVAAEGQCLKAHRIVLSACSPYFELLFTQEMKKDKVLVIENIGFQELKSLIVFMYQGHVTVRKDRLGDFVKAAESLQINGLSNDLLHNSRQESTKTSVVSGKENSASPLYYKSVECSGVGGESSDLQCKILKASSFCRKQRKDEKSFICKQTNVPEENVFLPLQSVLESDSNRETAVVPADKEPSMELKEEIDVEDTPIWESEDENSRNSNIFSSATSGKENRKELTSVPGTVSSSYGSATSPIILEIKAKRSLPSFSSASASIPSSASIASTSFVPDIPIVQCGSAMEDSSSCEQELAKQSVTINSEPGVKIEVTPAVFSMQKESSVEPLHVVWLEEKQFWKDEEVIIEGDTAVLCSQITTNRDLDVTAVTASGNIPAVWPKFSFSAFTSSCILVEGDGKEVKPQDVKMEKTRMNEQCVKQECSTVGKVIERGRGVIEVDKDKVEREILVMEEQEMKVETIEKVLETDTAVEQTEKEEDSTPLSERLSKMLRRKSHKCLCCSAVFHTVCGLHVHARKMHAWKVNKKERSNRCEVCMATFVRRSHLTRHMQKHTSQRLFHCDVCKKSFRDKGCISRHMRTHTGERPFQCEICEKTFISKSYLTAHKRTHTGERPFQCDICERSYNQMATLSAHKRIHTDERPFRCEVCEISFRYNGELTVHKRKHTGYYPFRCEVCEISFISKSKFTEHNRKHTGERPFQCEVCEKTFSRMSHLKVHKGNHTGERPFPCDVCEMSFSQLCNLTVHKRKHTGERPFQCDICKISFSQVGSLTVHKRKHTGERPFQCDVCKRYFSYKNSLMSHVNTHTSERVE